MITSSDFTDYFLCTKNFIYRGCCYDKRPFISPNKRCYQKGNLILKPKFI